MDQSTESFVNRLSAISPGVLAAYHKTVAWWDPDEPPDTCLLGDLGARIVEEFPSVDDAMNDRLFFEIEQAMASDDEALITVVATGMIEAMVGTANSLGRWNDIRPRLGELSADHADWWNGPC